ncbi:MAG: hydrogenase maturation nickel metallochaperone HypA [Gammaproteobacteria bacterium]|nr:MAG: hydrogenase maturation nickel metallochaperone HypA [Gammaproteobacteria bacterium]
MHEFAVCQALVKEVLALAERHGAKGISSIRLSLGPLSGVEPELLRHAYPLAAADTPASAAELLIEELPIRVRCQTCGAETEASPNRLLCGRCGDWHTQLLSGDEMLLTSVELNT